MKRITIHYVTHYVLGFALCLVGLTVLLAVLWKAWPNVFASQDVLSALEVYLWANEFDFGFYRLKLMHLVMMGAGAIVFGVLVLAVRRQVFYAGEHVLLQCPFCKNQWKVSRAKAQVECPHCLQFVQPTLVKTRK